MTVIEAVSGAIVALVALLTLAVALRRPGYLLLGLVLYLPVQEFVEKWLPPGPVYYSARFGAEAVIALVFAWVLSRRLLSGRGLVRSPIGLWIIAFVAAATISAALNNTPTAGLVLGVRPLLRYVMVFYIALNLELEDVAIERLLRSALVMAIGVSVVALMQSAVGGPLTEILAPRDVEVSGRLVRPSVRGQVGERTRVFATLGRYDTLGTFLSLMLLIGLSTVTSRIRSLRIWAILLWCVGVPALLLSYSRQSWLALYVGVLASLAVARRWVLFSAGVLSPLGIVVLAAVVPDAVFYSGDQGEVQFVNRILEPFSSEYLEISRDSYGRLFVMTTVAANMFAGAAGFGFGPGSFGSQVVRFLGQESMGARVGVPDTAAVLIGDVNWVSLFGQFGLVGLLTYAGALFFLLRRARMSVRDADRPISLAVGRAMCAIVPAFVVLGFFGPNLEVRQVSFYVWLLGGIALSMRRASPPSRSEAA